MTGYAFFLVFFFVVLYSTFSYYFFSLILCFYFALPNFTFVSVCNIFHYFFFFLSLFETQTVSLISCFSIEIGVKTQEEVGSVKNSKINSNDL